MNRRYLSSVVKNADMEELIWLFGAIADEMEKRVGRPEDG